MLTPGEDFDMEVDSPLVTHSIAEMMTIAEGLSVAYKDCIVSFENLLLNCWQSFELIGDVTISMAGHMIVVHTRHQDDASHQMIIVIVKSGVTATGVRAGGDTISSTIRNSANYTELLRTLGQLRLNRTRKIRTASDL